MARIGRRRSGLWKVSLILNCARGNLRSSAKLHASRRSRSGPVRPGLIEIPAKSGLVLSGWTAARSIVFPADYQNTLSITGWSPVQGRGQMRVSSRRAALDACRQ